jgi:hypothetical protein
MGKDAISDVRIRVPQQFSSLKCGVPPENWSLAYSDAIECSYKTVSDYIKLNETLSFFVNAVTAAADGNYIWEVRSQDSFDGFSFHYPVSVVDIKPPAISASALQEPNGGERWEKLSQQAILWNAEEITDDLAENPVTLEYATDGQTWSIIAAGEKNDGVFEWTVPDIDSNNTKIRISVADKAGNAASDESDQPFSIVPAAPTLTLEKGEFKGFDINTDGNNDIIVTLRSIEGNVATLVIATVPTAVATPTAVPTPEPTPNATATATPQATPERRDILSDPTITAVIVILILIIIYLVWKLQGIEKKKK